MTRTMRAVHKNPREGILHTRGSKRRGTMTSKRSSLRTKQGDAPTWPQKSRVGRTDGTTLPKDYERYGTKQGTRLACML